MVCTKCLMLSPKSDPVQLKTHIQLFHRGVLVERVVETQADLCLVYIMDMTFKPLVVR